MDTTSSTSVSGITISSGYTWGAWTYPYIWPRADVPYEQLPDCPDDTPPALYRCKEGHWHPMPEPKGKKS